MPSTAIGSSGRFVVRAACLVLIAVVLGRLAVVVPGWVGGAPPAYPDQYLGRLLFALIEVPILSVSLLALSAAPGPQPRWRRALPWALLAVSVVALALEVRRA